MNRFNFRFLILCLGLLLFSASLVFSNEPVIQASVGAISLDGEIEGLKVLSAGKLIDVNTIYPNTRNGVFAYRGSKQLTFFREQPAADPGEEPTRIPVAEVRLRGNHTRFLLFFVKKSGDAEAYSVFSIPDSKANFPSGTYRFFNLAPYKVAIRIGDEKKILEAKNITDIKGNFEHGQYYQTVMLSLPKEGAKPIPAYSGKIHFNKDLRVIMLIYPKEGAREGKIRFVSILDRVASQ